MENDKGEIKGLGWVSWPAKPGIRSEDFATRTAWVVAWLQNHAWTDATQGERPTHADIVVAVVEQPDLARFFVETNPMISPSVDTAYLTPVGDKYEVFFSDHGRRINVVQFDNLMSALAHYLYYLSIH